MTAENDRNRLRANVTDPRARLARSETAQGEAGDRAASRRGQALVAADIRITQLSAELEQRQNALAAQTGRLRRNA